jgi:hypothetical protein
MLQLFPPGIGMVPFPDGFDRKKYQNNIKIAQPTPYDIGWRKIMIDNHGSSLIPFIDKLIAQQKFQNRKSIK